MRAARFRLQIAVVVVAAVAAVAPSVRADAESCARAYEAAQSSRKDAKLLESRKQLVVCSQDSCPAVLRKDCVTWLSEVAAEIPAIAVRVHGKDGCDHPEAEITVDGVSVAHAAEGRPIDVDPGSHTVKATVAGASTEQSVVVTTADRRRVVTMELGDPKATCGKAGQPDRSEAPKPLPPPPPPTTPEKKPATAAYALGTVGVIGGAVAATFGVSAWSQKSTLDDCKGSCAQHDVDTMRRTFLVADVATLVAVAALGAATVLYLTR
jgi:hypothetical protein